MGFFSSRKTDTLENDNYHVTAMIGGGSSGSGEKSVVKVLRSRFYGKKGKEREEPISYIPQSVSAAQTLSIESPTVVRAPAALASSPLAGSSSRNSKSSNSKRVLPHATASAAASPTFSSPTTTSPSSLQGLPPPLPSSSSSFTQNERPLPATPATPPPKKWTFGNHTLPSTDFVTTPPPPMTPVRDRGEGRLKVVTATVLNTPSRMSSDGVTATLAQRLNELAVANADGLLNDDEYRLLRQNLFERFSSTSEVPRESPVVPMVLPRSKHTSSVPNTPDRSAVRPLSNFQVELPRPSSSQSKYSITSGVASLFRRTSGTVPPKDVTDTSSVWSQQSTSSSRWGLGRMLSRKSSNSSMQTTVSTRDKAEISPITPRRDRSGSMSRPDTPHSAVRRKLATPPSSFPSGMKQENRFPNSSSIYNVFDEDHLSTAAEIRQEILAVEAEVKRLMDAFMGLEVTTLSRTQRSRGYSVATTRSDAGRTSNVGSIAELKWLKRPNMADSDGGSVRSANSAATGPSMKPKSVHSSRFGLRPKASNTASSGLSATSSRPGSLRRKNSSSSIQSYGVGKAGTASSSSAAAAVVIPSVPALPNHIMSSGPMNGANNSSASLARSAHVMASVPEDNTHSATVTVATTIGRVDDDMVVDEGDELEEIRRRREEVQSRYGARLDYLRAKLKGAELHEKLMRK